VAVFDISHCFARNAADQVLDTLCFSLSLSIGSAGNLRQNTPSPIHLFGKIMGRDMTKKGFNAATGNYIPGKKRK
jgi:hypothetical protein